MSFEMGKGFLLNSSLNGSTSQDHRSVLAFCQCLSNVHALLQVAK
jgi:hypothetical protein